jgi:DNA-binding NarL/FixJ family response regulator
LFEGVEGVRPAVAVVELSLCRDAGADLLQQLRSRFPELKIIALSMHKEPSIVRMAIAAGADAYVLKSCIATDLPSAVESALAGKSYVSPTMSPSSGGPPAAEGPTPTKQ